MLNVVYVAPFPMNATMKFGKALANLHDVRLFGIFQKPPVGPQAEGFFRIIKIDDALDVALLEKHVRQIQISFGPVHRLLGVLENLQEELAIVRQRLNIYGMRPQAAHRFRDKSAMKQALRQAGVPCARYAEISSAQESLQFVERVGYPIILKPPSGAGCKATYRVNTKAELFQALSDIAVRPVLAEEFLTGQEYSMEAFTVNGQPRFASFSRYYPSPLEVMENPHLQWVVLFPRELKDPLYQRAKAIGYKAIRALGLQEGMTHMEWFCRPDGSVAVGEIGARPPGAQISEVTGLIHGFSTHQVWAQVMVFGHLNIPTHRNSAAAIVFLRGSGKGRVKQIHGLSEAQAKMGGFVVDVRLPLKGAPRSSSYEGDGWVIIQHPDTEIVKKAAWELITTIRVEYEH
ncbi:MAG: hypothetical protein CMK59_12595 [Proteobacteria bacterium]|nr:hypothetical protein [Pseudomonadota bacterium]